MPLSGFMEKAPVQRDVSPPVHSVITIRTSSPRFTALFVQYMPVVFVQRESPSRYSAGYTDNPPSPKSISGKRVVYVGYSSAEVSYGFREMVSAECILTTSAVSSYGVRFSTCTR